MDEAIALSEIQGHTLEFHAKATGLWNRHIIATYSDSDITQMAILLIFLLLLILIIR
jgi:hypothetical protein